MQKTVVATNDNIHKLVQDAIKKNGVNCDLNFIDVSQVTDMSYLFFGSEFIGDISKWNVSNVINMSQMFEMSHFNGDISQWEVSNVTDMSRMFANSQFNGDISRWMVSHVTNMYRMFADSQFNGNISGWDVSNVEDMSLMFELSQFNRDISCWKTPRLKNMSRMFCGSKFTEDISKWNVSNVTDMSSLFCGSEFNGNISRWKVENVTDMSGLFWGSKFTGDISKWKVSNVTTMYGMFFGSKFNGNISRWDVSKVNDMGEMFAYSQFNRDISKWDVSNVTDMSRMFANSQFNDDISQWKVLNVTNMHKMFRESHFNSDISLWKTPHLEDMSQMFAFSPFNGSLADWNVSNVKNMSCMFLGSSTKRNPFNKDISRWDVSNVMDMHNMFSDSEFNRNIDSWKVKTEADKQGMFYRCPLKNHVPIWYNFPVWLAQKFMEDNDLDSIADKAAESIIKAENIKKADIKVDKVEPYIKASIEDYCKKNGVDTNDVQIQSATNWLKNYLNVKYGLMTKFKDRTVWEPIINHAIATEQKKNITVDMLVPYIKDSLVKYSHEYGVEADDNQIQWVTVKLSQYYECIWRLLEKFKDRTVLAPIINHAIATEQKEKIPWAMFVPYIKDSLVKYCQENNIKADNNQIQWTSNQLVQYYGCIWGLWEKFKERTVLEPIINHAKDSIRKAEKIQTDATEQKNIITKAMLVPYIKDSLVKYCQGNNIKADNNQIQWTSSWLVEYYGCICWLLEKFKDRTVLLPIVNHAIDSIRKAEKIQADATEQKKSIPVAMFVPYIKDSIEKYCQENGVGADDNQIQWVTVKLSQYYEFICGLIVKFRDRTVLEPIVNHAIASIREAEKIQGDATAQKKDIPQAMVVPYIKDSLVKYCQENNITADNNQIQWASSELVRYYGCTYLLWVKFKDKAVLEQIINHAIESLRKSESVESAVVGQMNDIAIDMVEPYVKESIEKYCQENNVKADDNQMQWVANVLTKDYRNVLFQKIQEKDARAKMKEMLTTDAEEDLS